MKPIWKYIAVAAVLFISGCGGSGGSDPIADAWKSFEAKQYSQSFSQFQLIGLGNPEVNVGLGWNCIRLDTIDLANIYFQAIASDSLEDAYAGWSTALWIQGDYQACIDKANVTLQKSPLYSFQHDPNVTYQDLIWNQASGYFHLADYSNCINRIKLLDANFNANPNDANIDAILFNELEALSNQLQ